METTSRPESAPAGAELLDGVIDVYAEYDATKALAKADGATRDVIDAYDRACEALRAARKYWREIRQAVHEAAVAEWEAANPDSASDGDK